MKFTTKHSDFVKELAIVKGAVDMRTTTPMSRLLQIEVSGDTLSMVGNNMDFGIKSYVAIESGSNGACCIDAVRLSAWAGAVNGDNLSASTTKARINFKTKSSSIGISLASNDLFPPFQDVTDGLHPLKAGELLAVLSGISFVVADFEDPKFTLNGAQIELDKYSVSAAATNGQRLAIAKRETESPFSTFKFMISRKSILELIKLLKDYEYDDLVYLGRGNGSVFFEFSNRIMYCRVLAGNFPNYNKILPLVESQSIAQVNADEFCDSIRRAAVLCEDSKQINITFDAGHAIIANTTSIGESCDCVPAKYQGERFSFAINGQWLYQAVRAIGNEEVDIAFEHGKPHGIIEVRIPNDLGYRNIMQAMVKRN
jgi:DNA polymerase-3 subunit beta